MTLKAYQKHAWIIFVALGSFSIVRAPFIFAIASEDAQFLAGYSYLFSGLIMIGITLSGYVPGRKWAWYALWYVPVGNVMAMYQYGVIGHPWWTFIAPFVLSLLGLLVPYRRFFVKVPKQVLPDRSSNVGSRLLKPNA